MPYLLHLSNAICHHRGQTSLEDVGAIDPAEMRMHLAMAFSSTKSVTFDRIVIEDHGTRLTFHYELLHRREELARPDDSQRNR